MSKNILVAVLAVLALALVIVAAVYAAYPNGMNGMMNQQSNGYNSTHQMTEEQCETQMQNMHGSGFNGSMMGNYDHDVMHNDTASSSGGMMGRGGCH